MTNEISWQVVLRIGPGKLEGFRTLTAEMVEATKSEPGALVYERFISADRETVWIYERYRGLRSSRRALEEVRVALRPPLRHDGHP